MTACGDISKIKDKELRGNWARDLAAGVRTSQHMMKNATSDTVRQNELPTQLPLEFQEEMCNHTQEIASQFLPSQSENIIFPQEFEDPIGDSAWEKVKGVVHRYPNRVLLKPTALCSVYCRFCFRKNQVSKPEHNLNNGEWDDALQYIRTHTEIWEVIVTGGDPLTLTDDKMSKLIVTINDIPHVKIIRFHTRIYTMLPSRITSKFLEILKTSRAKVWMVCHINSHLEFKKNAVDSMQKTAAAGIPLLMQSVLLKGVNGSFEQLKKLFEAAAVHGIKPYYLHYLDLAQGTEHFRIPLAEAVDLFAQLRGQISGFCIPQFMIDLPGGHGKVSLENTEYKQIDNGIWEFRSPLSGKMVRVTYPQKTAEERK